MKIKETTNTDDLIVPSEIKNNKYLIYLNKKLTLLSENPRFRNVILQLRSQLGFDTHQPVRTPTTDDLYPVVQRCELAETKYKFLLVEAIRCYFFKGTFRDYIRNKPLDAKGRIRPLVTIQSYPEEKMITINMTLFADTTEREIKQYIKQGWKTVKKYQKNMKGKFRIKEPYKFLRDYGDFHIQRQFGLGYKSIHTLYSGSHISSEGVKRATKRIEKEIDRSFR